MSADSELIYHLNEVNNAVDDLIHVSDEELQGIIDLAGSIERAAIKERDLRKG